ncbi:MAG: hypothetical protein ACR2N1_11105 [Rubripirellula sp.]
MDEQLSQPSGLRRLGEQAIELAETRRDKDTQGVFLLEETQNILSTASCNGPSENIGGYLVCGPFLWQTARGTTGKDDQ